MLIDTFQIICSFDIYWDCYSYLELAGNNTTGNSLLEYCKIIFYTDPLEIAPCTDTMLLYFKYVLKISRLFLTLRREEKYNSNIV